MKRIEDQSNTVGSFLSSIKNIWLDSRIPKRDRWVIAVCLFLIISPLDILPDVIPVIGVVDDLILVSFILDYFLNRLDENIILDHLSGGRKRYYAMKSLLGKLCKISPQHLLHFLWKYKKPQGSTSSKNTAGVKNVN